MEIPIFQVDAFTSNVFAGNPAAVCPLTEWLPDETLQAIAAENNLAETAFFVKTGDGYHLRWFTPACEVEICGHATLASAFVLWKELRNAGTLLRFRTLSGELRVTCEGDVLTLDFPSTPPLAIRPESSLIAAMGGQPVEILGDRGYFIRYAKEAEVKALSPNMEALLQMERKFFIATAPGDECDFVSRFFAPALGIPEDPVTGSAHCTLTPYWAAKLGMETMQARQISKRGGDLVCTLAGDRVHIAGRAVLYLKGSIFV